MFIFGIKLYMFRTVPLSIIGSFLLYTHQWYKSYRVPSWSCPQAGIKPVWHIPLPCVQWKTPDDGQRNCPKHVEFYSKNKFEKLVHLVGFITRITGISTYETKTVYVISPTTDCFQAAVTAKSWGHFRHKGKANKQRHMNTVHLDKNKPICLHLRNKQTNAKCSYSLMHRSVTYKKKTSMYMKTAKFSVQALRCF